MHIISTNNLHRKFAEKYDIPLEINLTEIQAYLAGRKRTINYPSKEFWDIAANYNIKVLYGIDAHYKEQIDMYEDCIKYVNNYIGKEKIKKLNFMQNID